MSEIKYIDLDDSNFIIKISGIVSCGSEGNQQVELWHDQIKARLSEISKNKKVILDFSDLVYRFGNSIASLWMIFFLERREYSLVAKGETYKALSQLIKTSIPVDIFTNLDEAKRV
jgi:hypothetical protein